MLLKKETLKEILEKNEVKTRQDYQRLLAQLTEEITNALLEGELNAHLGYKKYERVSGESNNYRNGKISKTVKSQFGNIEVQTPRDRNATFEPKFIKKRETDITGMEDKIISLYGKGMSTRDICQHVEEIYNYEISAETVSNITDVIIKEATEWQTRSLDEIYPMIFMDGFIVKSRYEGIVRNICVYAVIGINLEGIKDVLGLYVSENESAKYWLTVMNDLKARGVKDILIFSVDNLAGISQAIQTVFPKSEIQKCIVHQIRNSLKYVSWKDRKEVSKDLKKIYASVNERQGLQMLEAFKEKWDKKYSYISKSWERDWSELSVFYKYPNEIRKLIYTTNPIESFNRIMRKVVKNKAIFPTEESIIKILYLTVKDQKKKWNRPIRDWGSIISQFMIYFEERLKCIV